MPDVRTHLQHAAHNEAVFAKIDANVDGDWAVTILFYSALQYVDAYLAKIGYLDPGEHAQRNRLIQANSLTRGVWRHYSRLKSYSENARYYAKIFSRSDVNGLKLGDFDVVKDRMTANLP